MPYRDPSRKDGARRLKDMSRRKAATSSEPVTDHSRQLPRLRRIEGQIRGLQQMIRDKRPCLDVINQASAAVAAIRRVQSDMLRDHLAACAHMAASGQLPEPERKRIADDIARLLKDFR
ncbi:MAG TPA: metal-sensitive transcriptional regulator [Terriglobales bacterium]|nr:metal-sensitive transcriptional regulator [Terriglobales bacterium]